jgi:hypothetical protein
LQTPGSLSGGVNWGSLLGARPVGIMRLDRSAGPWSSTFASRPLREYLDLTLSLVNAD